MTRDRGSERERKKPFPHGRARGVVERGQGAAWKLCYESRQTLREANRYYSEDSDLVRMPMSRVNAGGIFDNLYKDPGPPNSALSRLAPG